jgi:2-oxoisovalerate dehydrogenase E1 component beta subunit
MKFRSKAAQELSEHGHSVEVIDLRSMYPYDWSMIRDSVRKTGRVLFVNEDTEVTNFGEHLAYRVTQELFYELQARPRVLAGKNLPGIGLHPNLEEASVPHLEDIVQELELVLSEVP